MSQEILSFIQLHSLKVMLFNKKKDNSEKIVLKIKKVSIKEKNILKLTRDSSLTRDDLVKLLGLSSNVIKQHISKQKLEKIMERVGSIKAGYWKIFNAK